MTGDEIFDLGVEKALREKIGEVDEKWLCLE